MPKKRRGRLRKIGSNPYLPSLVTMQDRWTPHQIAGVITKIEDELAAAGLIHDHAISQNIVLYLSKLEQESRPGGKARNDTGPFGICANCNIRRADLVVEDGAGEVVGMCNNCYGMTVIDLVRPKEVSVGKVEPPQGDKAGDSGAAASGPEGHEREADVDEPDAG